MALARAWSTWEYKTLHWPKDNTAALRAFYGNPTGVGDQPSLKWERDNLVSVAVPWRMQICWEPHTGVSRIRIHKHCAEALARILIDIWETVGREQAQIELDGLHLFGGSFNYRLKRGLSTLSVHAFGAALDFDPARNGLGDKTPHMPSRVVKAFEKEGAVWGGNFKRVDGMHFQFATI